MNIRRLIPGLGFFVLCLAAASPAAGLANRVFVSARSGNNANSCDNVNSPCQTLTGALAQLNPDGEAIVLDSGGYGSVTITQGATIEAPAGVTAFIHPSVGDAITVNAAGAMVTLRGLVLNVGSGHGILVNSVGTLNVENCSITEFADSGIAMFSAGQLNIKGTDIKGCVRGVQVAIAAGLAQVNVDHCHFDGNGAGYFAATTSPGASAAAATNSTANGNLAAGWFCGGEDSTGKDVLILESCTASANGVDGLFAGSTNAQSVVRYSHCVFANNARGVRQINSSVVESRGNNTLTANGTPTSGTIGMFSPM